MTTSHVRSDSITQNRLKLARCQRCTLLLIAFTGLLGLSVLGGCQERVVSRRGIGAEETNPIVSERQQQDSLSKLIWPDEQKR